MNNDCTFRDPSSLSSLAMIDDDYASVSSFTPRGNDGEGENGNPEVNPRNYGNPENNNFSQGFGNPAVTTEGETIELYGQDYMV